MKNKKTAAVSVAAAVLLAAGCGASEPEPQEIPEIRVEEPQTQENGGAKEESPQSQEDVSQNEDTGPEEVSQKMEGQEYLPGRVRELGDDYVVVSRTFIEDSQVYIPEKGSADEELVTVRCTDDTEFEHWTIKGGGAGIERREASFSDITEDAGLETYGYYEDGVLIAQRMIIEIDV